MTVLTTMTMASVISIALAVTISIDTPNDDQYYHAMSALSCHTGVCEHNNNSQEEGM